MGHLVPHRFWKTCFSWTIWIALIYWTHSYRVDKAPWCHSDRLFPFARWSAAVCPRLFLSCSYLSVVASNCSSWSSNSHSTWSSSFVLCEILDSSLISNLRSSDGDFQLWHLIYPLIHQILVEDSNPTCLWRNPAQLLAVGWNQCHKQRCSLLALTPHWQFQSLESLFWWQYTDFASLIFQKLMVNLSMILTIGFNRSWLSSHQRILIFFLIFGLFCYFLVEWH